MGGTVFQGVHTLEDSLHPIRGWTQPKGVRQRPVRFRRGRWRSWDEIHEFPPILVIGELRNPQLRDRNGL